MGRGKRQRFFGTLTFMNDDEPSRPMIPLLSLFAWDDEDEAKVDAVRIKRTYKPRKPKEAKTETPSNDRIAGRS